MLSDFFKNTANLKNIPRQGWIEKLNIKNPESVADHTFNTAIISMVFSDLLDLDTSKVLKMTLLHDLAESVIGDLTPSMSDYANKAEIETRALKKILKPLSTKLQKDYTKIWIEYTENKTSEANLVHEADKLEMAVQAKLYQKKGIKKSNLAQFYNSADKGVKSTQMRKILSELHL